MFIALRASRLVCTLCAIGVASSVPIACGAATSPNVVARVGNNSVTKENLARWTAIEAVLAYQTDPTQNTLVPKGVAPDPPRYANCIAFLQANPGPGQSSLPRAQLKVQCEKEHALLQRHILDILLTSYWLRAEASEKGVKLTEGEIKSVLDKLFPSPAALRRYLVITGERPSDERLIIEKDLFDSKLLQLKEREMKMSRLKSEHERGPLLVRAAREFTDKWAARTWCRAGYVVSECKQYKGTRSLVAP